MNKSVIILALANSFNLFSQTTIATLSGYSNRQPDGLGFNWGANSIYNPWSTSTDYTNLLPLVNPSIIRNYGGTDACYWDCRNDIMFIDSSYSRKHNIPLDSNGWVWWGKTPGYDAIIKGNIQRQGSLADLKYAQGQGNFSVIFDINFTTPGKDFYAWKWGRTINDHPGTTNMNDDWWLMMNDKLQRNLNQLRRADSLGIPIKYVELGNEIYASDGPYKLEAFPNENISGTGDSYAIAANYFAQQIKTFYPNVQIAAIGANKRDANFSSTTRRNNWNNMILNKIDPNYVDYLTVHSYSYSDSIISFYNTKNDLWNHITFWNRQVNASYNSTQNLITAGWKIWYTESAPSLTSDTCIDTWGNSLTCAFTHFYYLEKPSTDKFLYQQFKQLLNVNNVLGTRGAALSLINSAANGMSQYSPIQFSNMPFINTSTISILQGGSFTNGTQTNCVILNLDSISHTVNLQTVFTAASVSVNYYSNTSLSSTITPVMSGTLSSTQNVIILPYSVSLITGVSNTIGIKEQSNLSNKLIIYPNPSQNIITFDYSNYNEETFDELIVYNLLGEIVYSIAIDNSNKQLIIDLKKLPTGIYTSVLIGKNTRLINKIIKQ